MGNLKVPQTPHRVPLMFDLPTDLFSRACRLYLEEAYPDGPASLTPSLRAYWEIPVDADVEDYLAPSSKTRAFCQVLSGTHPGYQLRLGCAAYPYLKMTIQGMPSEGQNCWLFGVDTHDSWHHPEHPDRAKWIALQSANRSLKARIETAWEAAGLLTQNRLLREELARSR